VKPIAQHFDSIQSVDRVEIINLLDRYAGEFAKKLELFLQVNISQEEQKSGIDPDQVEELAKTIMMKNHVKLKGLMMIGTQHADEIKKRLEFKSLYGIGKTLKHSLSLEHLDLSMGMSDDFPIAIEEGATMVRIGRYLVVEENTSTFMRNGVSLD
jgi:pyridoxal phosphate enzyme (YggS family)